MSLIMETNLEVIVRLSVERWADNWNFRAYLKKYESSELIDIVVHRLNDEISPQIDCTKCANCCECISPHLTDFDISRAASSQKILGEEFAKQYLQPDDEGEQVFRTMPCPFLKDLKCEIYRDRPADCRSYPHLHEPDFLQYSISTIENYAVCPIIFNVYERLKLEFNYDPKVDFISDEDQEP